MPREPASFSLHDTPGRLALAGLTAIGPWLWSQAETRGADAVSGDWPCQQVLVSEISLPAVWSGPPIEGLDWHRDQALAELVARLTARRTSTEDAERAIDTFAMQAGADKTTKLTLLFAGLFDGFNAERTQIIDGLIRFGRKLKELAAKIRAARAAHGPDETFASDPDFVREAQPGRGLDWDLRIFEEQRQSVRYVCETPALIEQRLFVLARAIQNHLD